MFKELFTESNTERAIFETKGSNNMEEMFKLVERDD